MSEPVGDILPCPFCSARAEWIECDEPSNRGGSAIQCTNPTCMASSKVVFGERDGLKEAWNRRLNAPAVDWEKVGREFSKYSEGWQSVGDVYRVVAWFREQIEGTAK